MSPTAFGAFFDASSTALAAVQAILVDIADVGDLDVGPL